MEGVGKRGFMIAEKGERGRRLYDGWAVETHLPGINKHFCVYNDRYVSARVEQFHQLGTTCHMVTPFVICKRKITIVAKVGLVYYSTFPNGHGSLCAPHAYLLLQCQEISIICFSFVF